MAEVLWNKFTAEAATLGQCEPFWEASGISFDTRNINKGDLFIALPGERDGHDFVKEAFEKGAAAAMVSKKPEGLNENDKLLIIHADDVGLSKSVNESTFESFKITPLHLLPLL